MSYCRLLIGTQGKNGTLFSEKLKHFQCRDASDGLQMTMRDGQIMELQCGAHSWRQA